MDHYASNNNSPTLYTFWHSTDTPFRRFTCLNVAISDFFMNILSSWPVYVTGIYFSFKLKSIIRVKLVLLVYEITFSKVTGVKLHQSSE